jgi:peptide methionine sulfoxide reductase MsrA
MQQLIRKPPGVISTRVGYTGGKVRKAPEMPFRAPYSVVK